MWCKTCNIETNEELCPVCGSVTIEDIPDKCVRCKMCVTAKYLDGGCMMDKYLRTK